MSELLNTWEIIGLFVLTGPLIVVLICLIYVGVKTGITDWRRRSQKPKRQSGISKRQLIHDSTNTEVQRSLEEIKSRNVIRDGEIDDRAVYLIKWLIRIIIIPFISLSYEAYRTFNIQWSHDLPFVPHALSIAVLSSIIVVVSTYYGFFVNYKKIIG